MTRTTAGSPTGSPTAMGNPGRVFRVIELLDTLFGFTKRFRPRSESAPGPLERPAAA